MVEKRGQHTTNRDTERRKIRSVALKILKARVYAYGHGHGVHVGWPLAACVVRGLEAFNVGSKLRLGGN